MKKLCVLFADHARRVVKLIVLAFAFTQMVSAATWYVATNGTGNGQTSWANATNSIQGAIFKAVAGDTVLVSNGVYDAGGVTNYPTGCILTNRIAITNAITVRSANNDPTNTIIKGAWNPVTTNGPAAVRGVYMTNGASLIGFTLTNGATLTTNESASGNDRYGGGIFCQNGTPKPIISNCVITGNSADYMGGGGMFGDFYNCTIAANSAVRYTGGGVCGSFDASSWSDLYNCTIINNRSASTGGGIADAGNMYNCILSGNSSATYGGGAGGVFYGMYNCLIVSNSARTSGGGVRVIYNTKMYNCTVVSNSAINNVAGGVYVNNAKTATVYNCIVYFNDGAAGYSNWYGTVFFTNSCTAPTATVWAAGNTTADPMFVNRGIGNFRLRMNSPCVNTGTNQDWMTNSVDLDGRARILNGLVDMGAYETILWQGSIYKVY